VRRGELIDQRRLAYASLAGKENQAPSALGSVIEKAFKGLQILAPLQQGHG
jgi:hypothetical protein